ncbi:hypothetical protein LCGC14_2845800 [marine sediment metagenome]|uniref:Uncharacterized protein n=1 Tax=marine sediment metagenome TaxID=412755 RepID=A0A0F9AI72_9ZZZZ
MTLREFHNGLRILLNLDLDELATAGAMEHRDFDTYAEFRTDPFRWFIRASDQRAEAVWSLMQERREP